MKNLVSYLAKRPT